MREKTIISFLRILTKLGNVLEHSALFTTISFLGAVIRFQQKYKYPHFPLFFLLQQFNNNVFTSNLWILLLYNQPNQTKPTNQQQWPLKLKRNPPPLRRSPQERHPPRQPRPPSRQQVERRRLEEPRVARGTTRGRSLMPLTSSRFSSRFILTLVFPTRPCQS
jgi:hypothetical protein